MAYSTIKDPSAYFQTAIYTGNGGTQSITNDGNSDLQPDLIWIKSRSDSSFNAWTDSTRGTSKRIYSNSVSAEESHTDRVTAFNSDGFSLGGSSLVNTNTYNYAAWQWKANGGTTTSVSASGTGNGCVNACTHQANTTAGFSIITYTGRDDELNNAHESKLTHGLGVAPKLFICKRRDSADDWFYMGGDQATVRHGWYNGFLSLNDNDAVNGNHYVSNTEPDATHIFLGNEKVNIASATYVGYAFAEVQGYSKFGKYVANGSGTDDGTFNGTFVYTGFKPAWVMVKRASYSAGDGWEIWDSTRPSRGNIDATNYINNKINASSTGAESGNVYDAVDFLSNGFKLRTGRAGTNASGSTYVYMAFAENPFVANGIPTTAR